MEGHTGAMTVVGAKNIANTNTKPVLKPGPPLLKGGDAKRKSLQLIGGYALPVMDMLAETINVRNRRGSNWGSIRQGEER